MHDFSVAMGLMDFVPVAFFGVTAVILLQDLYNKMFKGAYAMLAAGTVNVFTAGFCKALWKLLYAAGICAAMSILAAKMKKKGIIVLFVLSFVCAMGMGYMSSQDSSLAWVNWVEQSINTVSQLCLMIGTIALHKAGLAEYKFGEAKA